MLEKLKRFFEVKREQHKQKYDFTMDNVAIPEVHTHAPEEPETQPEEDAPISYENVAIPEVHIRHRKHK